MNGKNIGSKLGTSIFIFPTLTMIFLFDSSGLVVTQFVSGGIYSED